MSEDSKQLRLSKAAKEFNLSVTTILDYLGKHGHKLDSNPNTKISEGMYDMLMKEFVGEKTAKQEAIQVSQTIKLKKDTIVFENKKPAVAEKEEPAEILIKDVNSTAKPVAVEEKVVKPEVVEAPKVETPKAEIPAVQAEEAKPESTKREGDFNIKIVSRIDLKEFEPKKSESKLKKEEPKKVEPKKVVQEKVEEPKEVIKEPVAEIVVPVEVVPEKIEEEAIEHIETKYEKLSGPKLMGKIVLPVKDDKKKPVASSNANTDKKKKRKRIIKGGVTEEEKNQIGKTEQERANFNRTGNTNPGGAPGQNRGPYRPGPGGPNAGGGPNRGPYRPGQGGGGPNRGGGGYNNNREAKPALTEDEIQKQIKETLARLSNQGGKSKSSKYRKDKRGMVQERLKEEQEQREASNAVLQVTEFVSANQLAKMMDVPVNNVISTCMSLGLFVSINQRLDAETISIVADEFGYKTEFVTVEAQETINDLEQDKPEDLLPRAPIVTVMGHVDHGKTSLLDYIRKANVIAGEAGGITQHIGAYSVQLDTGKKVTFLDTPGHEAFTAMRARGAKVTDVAIIVVAADDSVMPQTKEAINHAQAAGVPMIFAINKMDKPGANPDKIREALSVMNILVEEWGGKFQCQEISAKLGKNIDLLLEKVVLEAELLELKANANKLANGTVIESMLDKGRGYVSTILVQAGTMRIGDVVLAGCFSGRVKAMFNERGVAIKEAGPSTPVSILGLSGAPQAGDKFNIMGDEREAREIANKRLQLQREQGIRTQKHITLDEIGRRLAIGDFQELNIIVKGDVDGSIEALTDALLKLSTEKIQVNVIHKSVGAISETDIMLASASNAIIVGFQVRPTLTARKLADVEEIDIRLYSIIYDAINEVKAAMEGMLAPEFEEKVVCNIEVRQVFKITKVGTIAGCYVLDGKVTRNTKVRVIRNGIVIHTGELGSLKRHKDDVKEVTTGYECGLDIAKFNDIEEKDIIEGYEMVEVKAKL
jgi:translation initiation factor IF-2